MTKAEIVTEIANKTGVEKVAVQAVVESFMETVKDTMVNGENVYLRGFGSFIIKKELKKQDVIFLRILQLLSLHIIFLLLNQLKLSLTK